MPNDHRSQPDPAAIDFATVAPGLGRGTPAPTGWLPVPDLPLTILVGLTGVYLIVAEITKAAFYRRFAW